MLLHQSKITAFAHGSVDGEQTVPRAELQAILHLEFTTGDATVHTDCLPVPKGITRLQEGVWEPKPDTVNGLMWRKSQVLLNSRPGNIRIENKRGPFNPPGGSRCGLCQGSLDRQCRSRYERQRGGRCFSIRPGFHRPSARRRQKS